MTAWYNNDAKGSVISEENGAGTLQMSYVKHPKRAIGAVLADLSSSNPASGTARYYSNDYSGSTRRLRDSSKSSLAQYEYDSYGGMYSESGASTPVKYTGHAWDDATGMYRTMYRGYSPPVARWISRDPIGRSDGPNLFAGLRNSPMANFDALGLRCCKYIENNFVPDTVFGVTGCCGQNGAEHKVCVFADRIGEKLPYAAELVIHCTRKHEKVHRDNPDGVCRYRDDSGIGTWGARNRTEGFQGECDAYGVEKQCATKERNRTKYCSGDAACLEQADFYATKIGEAEEHNCNCVQTPIFCTITGR